MFPERSSNKLKKGAVFEIKAICLYASSGGGGSCRHGKISRTTLLVFTATNFGSNKEPFFVAKLQETGL
jgi:hypothetical protein